jgi:hypothetical protein
MTWEMLQGTREMWVKQLLLFYFPHSISTGWEFAEIINDVYVIRKQVLKTTSFRRELFLQMTEERLIDSVAEFVFD